MFFIIIKQIKRGAPIYNIINKTITRKLEWSFHLFGPFVRSDINKKKPFRKFKK